MDLGVRYVSLEEGFDFVIEEATKDLGDKEGLVSDLEIPLTRQTYVIIPCSRHWTAPERVSKLGKGCYIASLGFGKAVTLIDVVLVARHGGGYYGSRSGICFFRRRV